MSLFDCLLCGEIASGCAGNRVENRVENRAKNEGNSRRGTYWSGDRSDLRVRTYVPQRSALCDVRIAGEVGLFQRIEEISQGFLRCSPVNCAAVITIFDQGFLWRCVHR